MRIGIDLGGTNIRMALVNDGVIIKKSSVPCKAQAEQEIIIDQLKELIYEAINPSVESIGIGVPSVVDIEQGIIYDVMNIPSWKEVHLKTILEKEFSVPVNINNDCNCFVYGEYQFGKSKTYDSVVGITLGTGLGCGIIIDKKLYNGHNTGAGEICAIPYLDHDYEYYCSTPFFVNEHQVSAENMFKLAKQCNQKALELWKEFGSHMGNMIKTVILAYDPPCIVLGGSISNAIPFFENGMNESLQCFSYPKSVERLQIYQSEVTDAALLGAALL